MKGKILSNGKHKNKINFELKKEKKGISKKALILQKRSKIRRIISSN
jgi:hypothetical protein